MSPRIAFLVLCLCLLQLTSGHALSRRLLDDLGRKEPDQQEA